MNILHETSAQPGQLLARGVARYLSGLGFVSLEEFVPARGLRLDPLGWILPLTANGTIIWNGGIGFSGRWMAIFPQIFCQSTQD